MKQKVDASDLKLKALEEEVKAFRGGLSKLAELDEINLRIEGILIEQKTLRENLTSFKRSNNYKDLGEPTFNELILRESKTLEFNLLEIKNKIVEIEKTCTFGFFSNKGEIEHNFNLIAKEQQSFEEKMKSVLVELRSRSSA